MENYYEIFGVEPDADAQEIEKAYKRLTKAYHPDSGATDDHMFKKVVRIYGVLSDPGARKAYDSQLAQAEGRYSSAEEAGTEPEKGPGGAGPERSVSGEDRRSFSNGGRPRQKPAEEPAKAPEPEKPDPYLLAKQAEGYLAKGSWKKAAECWEQAAALKPKEAKIWLGLLLASVHVKEKKQLAELGKPFGENGYYQKCLACANRMLREELEGYEEQVADRIRAAKYEEAVAKMKTCDDAASWQQASVLFAGAGSYRDAAVLSKRCREKAEAVRKDAIYQSASNMMNRKTAVSLVDAVNSFSRISGWRDADEQVRRCYELLAELKAEETDRPYQAALEAMERAASGSDYLRAADQFETLGTYRDAPQKAQECRDKAEMSRKDVIYAAALVKEADEKLPVCEEALAAFEGLGDYRDAAARAEACRERILNRKEEKYAKAREIMRNGVTPQDYLQASGLFGALPGYKRADEYEKECRQEAAYLQAEKRLAEYPEPVTDHPEYRGRPYYLDQQKALREAAELFRESGDWRDAAEKAEICRKKADLLEQEIPGIPEEKAAPKKRLLAWILIAALLAGSLAMLFISLKGSGLW